LVNFKKIINSKKVTRLLAAFGALMCVMSCFCASAFATEGTDSVDQVLGVMDKFTEKAIGANGVGSKVLTFITSNPLLLIGMAAFLLIMIIGVIRRFIIGV
jgi:hypothetical protein